VRAIGLQELSGVRCLFGQRSLRGRIGNRYIECWIYKKPGEQHNTGGVHCLTQSADQAFELVPCSYLNLSSALPAEFEVSIRTALAAWVGIHGDSETHVVYTLTLD
jgi:hypothetical protein